MAPDELGDDAQSPDDVEPGEGVPGDSPGDAVPPGELAPSRCVAPEGVSSAPRTIGEAVTLMNSLPRPTTLACFIESLSRPLEVHFTTSQLSAQPADGNDNPRIFIVNGPLFISYVPSGFAQNTIELGFRTTPERAVRAEIAFPLLATVTPSSMAEHIEFGERATFCSFCHQREARVSDPFLGELAFESDIIAPDPQYDRSLEAVRALAESCDASVTPGRCERFDALFDHGELRATEAFAEAP